jgi:hypothetical protein
MHSLPSPGFGPPAGGYFTAAGAAAGAGAGAGAYAAQNGSRSPSELSFSGGSSKSPQFAPVSPVQYTAAGQPGQTQEPRQRPKSYSGTGFQVGRQEMMATNPLRMSPILEGENGGINYNLSPHNWNGR